GAEFSPTQLLAYREKGGAEPVAIRVAHAALDAHALSGPLAVFVHRGNPLSSLGMDRLARAFTGEAKTWGDLGAHGDWATKLLHPYGMNPDTALAYFFRERVLGERLYGERVVGSPPS